MTRTPTARGRNIRLAAALKDQGITLAGLAAASGLHLKSVQRWLYEGRVPQRRAVAVRVGELLEVDPSWLWPSLLPRMSTPDLVCVYGQIDDVPSPLWRSLAMSARDSIEIATDTDPILPVVGFASALEDKADSGVPVRLCLGDQVYPIFIPGVETRRSLHPGILSLYRFGGVMLVWANRGGPGIDRSGPVLHLSRVDDNGVFDAYAFMFRQLWGTATTYRHRPIARSTNQLETSG